MGQEPLELMNFTQRFSVDEVGDLDGMAPKHSAENQCFVRAAYVTTPTEYRV